MLAPNQYSLAEPVDVFDVNTDELARGDTARVKQLPYQPVAFRKDTRALGLQSRSHLFVLRNKRTVLGARNRRAALGRCGRYSKKCRKAPALLLIAMNRVAGVP